MEKALKAYLVHARIEFPFTHNLSTLIRLCVRSDESFANLEKKVEPLTPSAVALRYDSEFWPEKTDAEDAKLKAEEIVRYVQTKLNEEPDYQ